MMHKKDFIRLLITCSLLWLAPASIAQSQTTTITGTVTSAEDHKPLIGVTVRVKDTKAAAITDENGHYKLKLPANGERLIFSYTGHVTREEQIKGRTAVDVSMTIATKNISDVVVVGYATVRRKDLTGSVSSVNAKQLKDIPVNSAAEALTGRLAGVQITSSEGKPGSDFTIKVRGGGSVTQDNSPLYIIDGVQVEDGFAGIAPQDIESVDVLKDASATAIYGARGANGVVIITTKNGKEGKTIVSYNGTVGVRQLPKKLKVLSPYDFVLYQYERSRGLTADSLSFANIYGEDLEKYKSVPGIDWQQNVFGRKALMQTHNVSIAGGTQSTRFNLSYTNNQEEGIMINAGMKRNLLNFKLDHKANTKLRIGLNVRYSDETYNGAGSSNEGASAYNGLRHAIKYRPFNLDNNNAEDEDDVDYYNDTNAGNGLGIINPILLSDAQYRRRYTRIFNIGGYLNYTFSKHFSFRSTIGYDRNNQELNAFDGSITSNSRLNGANLPLISNILTNRSSLNNSNVFTYTNRAKSGHHVNVLLGEETYTTTSGMLDNELRYFPAGITPEKAFGQFNLGTTVPLFPKTTILESSMLSFFGKINYDYQDKYLLSASLRADGSSKFAPDKRWGYFPSAALSWRISQEAFMKEARFISDLKLRVSYGLAGNNRIGDYLYLNTYSANAQYALNEQITPGYAANSLANKNLKWETTISRNIGLDAAFFKDRLQFTADLYYNKVKDLLIPIRIPTSSGYLEQLQNIGTTTNKGIELQLAATIIQKNDFSWNSTFNIAFNRNKVESLSGYLTQFYRNSGWGISGQPADFIVRTGEAVGAMYGFVNDGFYTLNDFNYDANTKIYSLKPGVTDVSTAIGVAQPGWMKLKDLNGDGIIDENDKTIIGNANPTYSGGLNQQFTYKNFDLSIFLNFVVGNSILNANKVEFTNAYSRHTNMLGIMGDRWRTIDDNGKVIQQVVTIGGKQAVTGASPEELAAVNANAKIWMPLSGAGAFYPTSWAVEDGSFLRVNNVTIGYTFPSKWLSRAKIGSLRVYATGNNLAVLTRYTGYDPEVNTRRSTPITPGVDYAAYPRSRSFFFGLNLTL
ncbi:SusC/RagA family TonB-linked outer membrane protein [Chitinophaga qingshengii]|nr:TonB-dependent receptor [Chitinophaga qingshengii]